MIDYSNLGDETATDLIEEMDHLAFALSSQNPVRNYFGTANRKRTARYELERVRAELRRRR